MGQWKLMKIGDGFYTSQPHATIIQKLLKASPNTAFSVSTFHSLETKREMSSLSCPLISSLVILTQTLHALYSEFWTRVEAMKGTGGKFFRKLKFIPSFSTLKQGLALQLDPSEKVSSQNCQIPPVYKERDGKSNNLSELLVGSTGVSELDNHPQDEEMELDFSVSDKDCFTSSIKTKDKVPAKETPEIPILSRSIMEHGGTHEAKDSKEYPYLLDFEEKCPPGGSDSIVFYTTSLRGIRKTFEDCSTIRFLLESFKVLFYERDVSMHLEYREELWNIMGSRVIPPRIFIKGRYIGGADEVVSLHEQGKLRKLLEGIPLDPSSSSCSGCANVRFVVCPNCNGSRKIIADGESDDLYIRCPLVSCFQKYSAASVGVVMILEDDPIKATGTCNQEEEHANGKFLVGLLGTLKLVKIL